jgi:hypothetical protein
MMNYVAELQGAVNVRKRKMNSKPDVEYHWRSHALNLEDLVIEQGNTINELKSAMQTFVDRVDAGEDDKTAKKSY